jgi:hypothetical protein
LTLVPNETYWVTDVLDQQRSGHPAGLILLHSRHTSELRKFRDSFGVGTFQGRSFVGRQHRHDALLRSLRRQSAGARDGQ